MKPFNLIREGEATVVAQACGTCGRVFGLAPHEVEQAVLCCDKESQAQKDAARRLDFEAAQAVKEAEQLAKAKRVTLEEYGDGWLIERRGSPARWLTSLLVSGFKEDHWTDVASDAVLLETERDANNECMRLGLSMYARPTEHTFIMVAPTVAPLGAGDGTTPVVPAPSDGDRTASIYEGEGPLSAFERSKITDESRLGSLGPTARRWLLRYEATVVAWEGKWTASLDTCAHHAGIVGDLESQLAASQSERERPAAASDEPLPPQYVLEALASIGVVRNPEHDARPTDEEPWMTVTEPNGEQPADSLRDALQTMTQAAENDMRARFRAVLQWHTLAEIRCDHATKTDTAMCGCALWRSDAMPSVGAATSAWVEHVLSAVDGSESSDASRAQSVERERPALTPTFDELVEYGRTHGANIVNGMPWSFTYHGQPVTHENDNCYLLQTPSGMVRIEREWPAPCPDCAAVSHAIGTNEFMDPPDGGSPTLAEQVARMRAALTTAESALAARERESARLREAATEVFAGMEAVEAAQQVLSRHRGEPNRAFDFLRDKVDAAERRVATALAELRAALSSTEERDTNG